MNQYMADRKTKRLLQKEIDEKDAELQRLRVELDAAKAQPLLPQQDSTFDPPVSSQQRVDEVEAELEALRRSFAADDEDDLVDLHSRADQAQPVHSWSHVPHTSGPTSDGGDTILIHEDDDADVDMARFPSHQLTNSDAMNMGLELQAARAAKSTLLGSFRSANTNALSTFHFADSPAHRQTEPDAASTTSTFQIPDTPQTLYYDISKQLKAATNRAEEAELALTALDVEITNIGFGNPDTDDTLSMVSAIATHFRTARLELERLVPGENTAGFDNPAVLPQLLTKLRQLADRLKAKEAEVRAASDQHHNLKGNFEKAIIAAEKANEEAKRLESALDTAVEESLHVRMRSQELERDLEEKQRNVSSLGVALDKYRSDISRLEALINDLQTEYTSKDEKFEELEARVASETSGRRAAEDSAVQRLARINELESALASSRRCAADLESQLTRLQSSSSTGMENSTAVSSSQQHAIEITALNARISSMATALASANAEVEKLRVTKSKLEERVRSEVDRAAASLQDYVVRSTAKGYEAHKKYVIGAKVRIANWQLEEDDDYEPLGSEDSGCAVRTPRSASSGSAASVRFAEWAEVETVERADEYDEYPEPERNDNDDDGSANESESVSVPGSVEIYRGRSRSRGRTRYKKKPRLVSFEYARRSRGSSLDLDTDTDPDAQATTNLNADADVHVAAGRGLGIKRIMKRRYDSGIGMSPEDERDQMDDGDCVTGSRAGRGVRRMSGMMSPELSSEGDRERGRDRVVDLGMEM